ncbi:MAG: hypothetical protein HYT41_02620 [Candidatus Sungbacteria bacterium]|nr:hypothetical protein [Candidatus Sungbacteria bacterium]
MATTTTSVTLGSSVKLVALQFSIPNPAAMPPSLRHLPQETEGERQRRSNLQPGLLVIPETPNVQIVDFVAQVAGLGYQLVSAIAQERPNLSEVFATQPRNRARYVLRPNQDVKKERAAPDLKNLMGGLMELCLDAMWTVKGYLNPYREGDVEYTELYCLDIVLGTRRPFCDRDGRPLMARPKDANGKTIRDAAPQPLAPDFLMKLVDGEIAFVQNI